MDFSSDANENFEGLLEVNREIFMPQMTEKTSPDAPPNCAAVPLFYHLSYAPVNVPHSEKSADGTTSHAPLSRSAFRSRRSAFAPVQRFVSGDAVAIITPIPTTSA